MIYYSLIAIYCLFFTILAQRRFNFILASFFFLLPTYLIRFNLGPLPTTLLEVMLWIITIIWLIKYWSHITYHITRITKQNKLLFIGIILFLLSATISLFTSANLRAALGEWKAFYIEPIILFTILITTMAQSKISNFKFQISNCNSVICNLQSAIIFALILSGLATSILAIYQHFTGYLVPYAFWQNQNTFRVTAWYGFPNAVGLFLAPLVPLAIYLLTEQLKKLKSVKSYYLISLFLLSTFTFLLAIIYSKGTGPLLGAVGGIGFLLLIYKKTRWLTLAVGFVSLVSLVSFPGLSGLKQEILLQDRSGQIRIGIWQETLKFLTDHPIAGAGLASYAEKIAPYHQKVNGENIEIFHHPHNIFLTIYINLGLLGLLSFIIIIYSYFRIIISNFQFPISNQFSKSKFNNLSIYLGATMTIILVMGLVDSPYIKNDLAILFWLLPALLITNTQKHSV